jgi:hypothetical protein
MIRMMGIIEEAKKVESALQSLTEKVDSSKKPCSIRNRVFDNKN